MRRNYIFVTLILFFGITVFINGAILSGKVYVENSEDYGVFIYIEELNRYDITNIDGEFEIAGLNIGEEYTIIFQKEDFPEVTRKMTMEKPDDSLVVDIKKHRGVQMYSTKGTIQSTITDKDIFISLKNKGFGIIAKPNVTFYVELEPEKYDAEIIQEGAQRTQISFKVEEVEENDIGRHRLIPEEKNSLLLNIRDEIQKGYLYLYRSDVIVSSRKLNEDVDSIKIGDLERGAYSIEIKAFGFENYRKDISVSGNSIYNINLNELIGKNTISVNILPENLKTDILVYQDRVKIAEYTDIQDIIELKGLDPRRSYELIIEAPKYKTMRLKEIYPGEVLDIHLVRDIKGYLISGNVFPFNVQADIKLLGGGDKVLAKTFTKENGEFELETDNVDIEPDKIFVFSNGFKKTMIDIDLLKNKHLKNVNIEIEPIVTAVFGRVDLQQSEDNSGVIVIIKELNLWQKTNEKGEFYFSNIPEGIYTINYRKFGYETHSQKSVVVVKNRLKETKATLIPEGTVIFRSDVENYNLKINGVENEVSDGVYSKDLRIGEINIFADKENFLSYTTKVFLKKPGEIIEVKINLINEADYKTGLENRLNRIRELIKNMKLISAATALRELKRMRKSDFYSDEIEDLEMTLAEQRSRLFDIDRDIRKKLREKQNIIETVENENIRYFEKRRQLNTIYKESLEYLEGVMIEHPYTLMKEEIFILKGDIYSKMGMSNIAQRYYDESEQFQGMKLELD